MTKTEEDILAQLSDSNLTTVILRFSYDVGMTDRIAEALVRLPELTDLKVVFYNKLYNLSFLQEAKRLTSLAIHYEYFGYYNGDSGHIEGIDELRQLKSITADDTTLYNLATLAPLQGLEELRLIRRHDHFSEWGASSEVRDVSPLKVLPKLHTLELRYNNYKSDLTDFAVLKQIKRLSLGLHCSHDISPLGALTQLEELELGPIDINTRKGVTYPICPIPSIDALAGLVNLTSFSTRGQFSDVGVRLRSLEPVKEMKRLQRLDCPNNLIRSLKPLMKLTELRELDVSCNPIKDYSPIRGLPYYKANWEPTAKEME